jgi:lysophospholipid acyltransferase
MGRAASSDKSSSASDFRSGPLGLPDDPLREIEEIQLELQARKEEILRNRRKQTNGEKRN